MFNDFLKQAMAQKLESSPCPHPSLILGPMFFTLNINEGKLQLCAQHLHTNT